MPGTICIFGAGSIGCYVGGRLAAGGASVTLVGRERIAREVRAHGLRLTDLDGADVRVSPDRIAFATDPGAAAGAGLVLVTVKSGATAEAGAALAGHCHPSAVVVSFQNGLRNADALRAQLPRHVVLAGMVQFNVIRRGEGCFHHGSEGGLEVEAHPALAPWRPAFAAAGLPLVRHADIRAVQWAKLLLNLNNPVNALSNRPLREELAERAYRRCVALAQAEALALVAEAGIRPARLTPVPPGWIPRLLGAPDWLFRLLANRMLAIDPLARSSMWEDLEAGRPTEIEWINGEVVALAARLGRAAPVNARLVALMREAEQGGRRAWTGEALLAELRRGVRERG